MKRLLVFLSLIPLFNYAQVDEIQLAEGADIRDEKINFIDFFGEKDGLIYVLAGKSWEELNLLAYDKTTMGLDHENEVEEIEDPVYVSGVLKGESIYPTKNGVYHLRYGYERKEKSIGLFVRTIGWDGSSTSYKRVFTVESLPGFSVTRNELVVEVSPDKSKIMVYSFPFRPSSERPVQIVVFNNDFEELYRTALSSPFEGGLSFIPTQLAVDNEGGGYVLGYRKKPSKEDEIDPQAEITDQYGVFKVDESGIASVLDLAGEDRVYHDLFMSVHSDGVDLLGLFLTNPATYESDNLFLKLDGKLNVKNISVSSFGQNVLDYFDFDPKTEEKYKYGKYRKSTLKGFLRFRYKDLMRWPDGTYTAVAEREVSWVQGVGMDHAFDEILLVNLDAGGTVKSGEVIDLHQSELNAFSSYVVHKGKDKVYVLFNDDIRNEERRKLGEEPYRLYIYAGIKGKANTMVASFDTKGKIEYRTIRTFMERYSCLRTAYYLDMGDEEAAFHFGPRNDEEPGGEHIVRIKF